MKERPSVDQIRASYFGAQKSASQRRGTPRSLTASTHYVVQQAKERIQTDPEDDQIARLSEADLQDLIRSVELDEGEELTENERESAVLALGSALQNYDVLTPLLANDSINDIIVRAFDDISVQSGRANLKTDYAFTSPEAYEAFVENLLKRAGKSCTTATPVVDAAVDTHVRACVTHKSFSPPGSGPMLTLRVARHKSVSVRDLVSWELAPQSVLDYLVGVVRHTDATILIAGEVGTGKTTLVRALAAGIDPREAILCIEDTHEIVLERDFVRTLLTRDANTDGAGKITPAQAIRTGMRMAMNRVILGEMRDAQAAEAFIDVCASGHPGFSTIHARSAKDAVARLELFLARAQPSVDVMTLRRQIANAVSIVVYLAVDPSQQRRRISEIVEIHPSNDGSVHISPMYRFVNDDAHPLWRRESGISQFQSELEQQNVMLDAPGAEAKFSVETIYRNMH